MAKDFSDYKYVDFFHAENFPKPWKRFDLSEVPNRQALNKNIDVFTTAQRFATAEKPTEDKEKHLCDVYFDFDAKDDIAKAQADVIELLNFIRKGHDVPSHCVRVWFSGNKGFHVFVDYRVFGIKPDVDLTLIIKSLALYLESYLELKTLDTASIYSRRRMIRLPDSQHSKSHLFKVELSHDEVKLPIPEIKALAAAPRGSIFEAEDYIDVSPVPELAALFKEHCDTFKEHSRVTGKESNLIQTKDQAACVKDLLENHIKEAGQRNIATVFLTCYFKKAGLTEQDTAGILLPWALRTPKEFTSTHAEDKLKASTLSSIKAIYQNKESYFNCAAMKKITSVCDGKDCPVIEKKSTQEINLAEYAADLCKQYHIIFCANNFYIYKDGVYCNVSEEEIQQQIITIKNNFIRMSTVKEIIFFMRAFAYLTPEGLNNTEYLNLKNGLFDLTNNKLLPHTPDIYSTIQLQVSYNQIAKCEKWLKTLNEIFENDTEKIRTLQEYFGLCFTRTTKYEKALFCIGEGANGKSVILNTLGMLIGKENYSAVPLELFAETHYLINLFGRLINISIETNATSQVYDSTFKAVTSGDSIEADQKFKPSIKFKPFCKLIFAVNSLPPVSDKTNAFFRRLVILRFNKEFEEEIQDKNLKTKLLEELDGIFIWCLEGLKRLTERGYFIQTESMKKEISDYRRENNNVISFFSEKCSIDDPDAYESKEYLYREYKLFCKDSGYHPLSIIKFGKEIKRQFRTVIEMRTEDQKGWLGVKILLLSGNAYPEDTE